MSLACSENSPLALAALAALSLISRVTPCMVRLPTTLVDSSSIASRCVDSNVISRKLLHDEEIGLAQVLVALLLPGGDRCGLDASGAGRRRRRMAMRGGDGESAIPSSGQCARPLAPVPTDRLSAAD